MTAFGRVVVLRNVVALGVFVAFGRVLFWPCVVVIVDGGCGGGFCLLVVAKTISFPLLGVDGESMLAILWVVVGCVLPRKRKILLV